MLWGAEHERAWLGSTTERTNWFNILPSATAEGSSGTPWGGLNQMQGLVVLSSRVPYYPASAFASGKLSDCHCGGDSEIFLRVPLVMTVIVKKRFLFP